MKRWMGLGLLIGFPMLMPAWAVQKPAETNPTDWRGKMLSMEVTLRELLVDLSSDERFNSKEGIKRVDRNAEKLAKIAHSLKEVKNPETTPIADPSIQIIGSQFAAEAAHAYETLKHGHRAYARDTLKGLTGYCMACHTRNASGPQVVRTGDSDPLIKNLKGVERGMFFAAVRQFDQSLVEYKKVLDSAPTSASLPPDWEQAARNAIAISVRVKKDRDLTLKLVEQILGTEKAPYFFKEQVQQWKKSVLAWQAEGTPKPQTEEGYYRLAVKLLADAKAAQKYPADRSADILYLRASAAIHDLMSFAPNGEHIVDALYLAGLSYEVLRDVGLWDIHELYFLSCIMKAPHTEKSRQCYKHYEESIYLGYSGSGGVHLPAKVRERLAELDELSDPMKAAEKPSKNSVDAKKKLQ